MNMLSQLIAISAGLLLVSNVVLSEINISLNYDYDLRDSLAKKYDIRGTINIFCKVTTTANENISVKWKKEDKDVSALAEVKDRLTELHSEKGYQIKITKATEDDAGMYFCTVIQDGQEVKAANISLFSKFRVKTPSNLNFVEGEPLKIVCTVYGKPTPHIKWKVGNETFEESGERVQLLRDEEKEVDNAIFLINEASMDDRGVYTCVAETNIGKIVSHETIVRIKDKYAALWPFLGICAEVFILCAIILIYEKKRNKTELEESDTDQSPDQKNTSEQGKDSNLRHRQ